MLKKIFIILLFAMFSLSDVHAGDDNFGFWANVEVKKKIVKDLSVSVAGEIRSANTFDEMERWTLGADVAYRINKHLKVDLDYTFIDKYQDWRWTNKDNIVSKYWSPRHRLMFSITGQVRVKRLIFSLRERYHYNYRIGKSVEKFDQYGNQIDDEIISSKSKSLLRSRFQIAWNIKKSGFEPYVFYELYNSLNRGCAWDKMRWAVGTDYNFSKRHAINIFYYYFKSYESGDEKGNIIGVGYKFNF